MERLKRRDAIVFSSNVILFEDELADDGISQLSARCRVMREGYFFVLLRFYMRVDGVLLRYCDTRIVGDDNSGRVIREWQLREAKYENLRHVDPEALLDVDRAWMHLPIVEEQIDCVSNQRQRIEDYEHFRNIACFLASPPHVTNYKDMPYEELIRHYWIHDEKVKERKSMRREYSWERTPSESHIKKTVINVCNNMSNRVKTAVTGTLESVKKIIGKKNKEEEK
ncbi:hypothetical protein B9Z55_011562 [Caenorhabditis nigoni]|nr:hypothetical protein B9Z55_011562 [Caenorhabditis nigoni]